MPVSAVPHLVADPPAGLSRLAIEVQNIGGTPARQIDVAITIDDPTRTGPVVIGGTPVNPSGRRFAFQSDDTGPLAGNGRRCYSLPAAAVEPLREVVAVLSPDQYRAAVTTADEQVLIE